MIVAEIAGEEGSFWERRRFPTMYHSGIMVPIRITGMIVLLDKGCSGGKTMAAT